MKTKTLSLTVICALMLLSCGQNASSGNNGDSGKVDQSDPVSVVNQIFQAAKSGKYEVLLNLCDPTGEGDGDTKRICSIQSASQEDKNEFNDFFKLGQVIGEPDIVDNQAKVQIMFGPDGGNNETINLVNRDGKWYLYSL